MPTYWVYILASHPCGTPYIDVTNALVRSLDEHRAGIGSAFTRKYKVHELVWYEAFGRISRRDQARETLKHHVRAWKLALIERSNPRWVDLCPSLPGIRSIPDNRHLRRRGSSGQARG